MNYANILVEKFIKNRIIAHLPFSPNPGQEQLVEKLATFLFTSEERPCFVLRGYAGTGKSSLTGALVKAMHKILN